jgi:dihydrofolate reductase
MNHVTCQITMSLDGFVAGPNQSVQNPLGENGEALHRWMLEAPPGSIDAAIGNSIGAGVGAYVMGRNMFGGGPGEWDASWRGWWGDNPPYHAPVFVLTHHPRPSLEMEGGTTFHFVTDGPEAALERACAAAGDREVHIPGGADCVRQYLRLGVIDELWLRTAPMLLGSGERLFEDVGDLRFEQLETIHSPLASHVHYRIVR